MCSELYVLCVRVPLILGTKISSSLPLASPPCRLLSDSAIDGGRPSSSTREARSVQISLLGSKFVMRPPDRATVVAWIGHAKHDDSVLSCLSFLLHLV